MGVPDFMMSVGAWFAPVAAIAILGVAAAAILLRDYLRVERQMVALKAEVEQLQNQFDTLRDAAERAPAPAGPASAPVARIEPVPAMPHPAIDRSAEVEPRSGPKRVLLAEDDEANALFAVKSLERVGELIIDWAKDGLEAVNLIEEAFAGQRPEYDLVLMDLRMPHLGGLDRPPDPSLGARHRAARPPVHRRGDGNRHAQGSAKRTGGRDERFHLEALRRRCLGATPRRARRRTGSRLLISFEKPSKLPVTKPSWVFM